MRDSISSQLFGALAPFDACYDRLEHMYQTLLDWIYNKVIWNNLWYDVYIESEREIFDFFFF